MISRIALALIPLSLAVVFYPCLAGTHLLSGFDFTGFWYPLMAHAQEWFHREGTLPFWVPQLFCGIPLGESLGPTTSYPSDILGWALKIPPHTFYFADTLIHLGLGAAGAIVLARAFGVPPASSAVSGLAYMLGGILMVQVRVGIPVTIRFAALLPWVFVLLESWQAGRNARSVAAISGLFGLMILANAYQMLSYLMVITGIYLFFRRERVRSLGTAALALLAGGILAGVNLLPNLRYYFHTIRSAPGVDWGAGAPLFFSDIPLLLFPRFNGDIDPERVKYLGLTVVILALAGAVRAWRKMAPWLAILAVAFLLALGSQTPVGQAVAGIPILGGFRVPMKWMLFGQLAVALLAGTGAGIFEGKSGKAGRILAVLVPLLVAGDLIRWELRLRKIAPFPAPSGDMLEQRLGVEKGVFRVESVEPAPVINHRLASGREWITGYHPSPMARFVDFYAGSSAGGKLPAMLPWMNARFMVASASSQAGDRYTPRQRLEGPDPVFQAQSKYLLCEAADFAPRAWMATDVVRADSLDETLTLLARYPPSSGIAVVEAETDAVFPKRPGGGSARFIHRTPNAVEIEASARNQGLLVLAESFYPAWEARVEGKRVPILRTNWLFRGVQVPAGKHRVLFQWNSVVFNLGLLISLLSWSILAGLICLRNRP